MKKNYLLSAFAFCCAFFLSTAVWADSTDEQRSVVATDEVLTTESEAATDNEKLLNQLSKVVAELPKFSGYLQTGYNWGDKNGDNRSSFQMKRMRVFIDKKIGERFDFRVQLECFSTSPDGSEYKKKNITVMDAYVSAKVTKALNFRGGQYFLPLGFENYDISPATLETVDFSNICYRMVCRNAVSTPNFIDYGRDIGLMAFGDLFENKEKGFSYLSYNLSLTNGYLPTLNDDNKSKDFVGRLTFRPVKDLRIMASYNWGEYKGLDRDNISKSYLPMNRYIAGAWYYDPNGLNVRAEYGYIKSSKANVEENGFYLLAAYKINKFLPVARWDMYRDKADKTSANNRDALLVGCSYELIKNIKFQANYIHSIYTSKVKDAGVRTGSGNSIQVMCIAKF